MQYMISYVCRHILCDIYRRQIPVKLIGKKLPHTHFFRKVCNFLSWGRITSGTIRFFQSWYHMYWWTFLVLVVYSPNSTVYEYIDNQLGKWFLTQCCNISSPAKLILVFIYALYLIYHSKLFPHPLPVHLHLWYTFSTNL